MAIGTDKRRHNFSFFTRASVKKLSSILKLSRKLLGTSQDVQIVDDSAAAQIEEILAHAPVARASALPVPHMGEGMLNRHPFAQFGSSRRASADGGAIR
jgi:hypothetical protein